jgi:hypothetical protein
MRAVEHLPMGGEKFKSSVFKQKLKSYARTNHSIGKVSDHQEAISKVVSKYAGLIKKGGFNSTYQNSALRKIKSSAPLSAKQTVIIKNVLKRLAKTVNKDVKVSHARINRAEDQKIKGSKLANQPRLASDSGLSGVSSPDNLDRQSSRPMVSISQAQRSSRSGLTGKGNLGSGTSTSAPASRPSTIPLSR